VAQARNVTLQVMLNGAALGGVIEAEVKSNSYFSANEFGIKVALDIAGTSIWSESVLEIAINMGVNQSFATLITGLVDRISIDPILRVAEIQGRDLTSVFIDSRVDQTFENLSASEVVTALALKHALIPNVFPTPDLVGRYFQAGFTQNTYDQYSQTTTEWDLIVRLAQQFGYDAWVDGNSFYFQPSLGESSSGLVIQPNACLSLRLDKSVPLANGAIVTVKSWNSYTQTAVIQSVGFGTQSYVVLKPNLTDAMALFLATQIWIQMSQHEKTLEFSMPGDVTSLPRMTVNLSETGTEFDDVYIISEISRRFSLREGFIQDVCARRPAWMISSML